MLWFIITLIVLLVIWLGVYYYLDVKRQRERKQQQHYINKQIKQIQQSTYEQLNDFCNVELLTTEQCQAIYNIASFYFITLPKTPAQLSYFEKTCERLTNTLSCVLSASSFIDERPRLNKHINRFIAALPRQAAQFNQSFYYGALPELLDQLSTVDANPPTFDKVSGL